MGEKVFQGKGRKDWGRMLLLLFTIRSIRRVAPATELVFPLFPPAALRTLDLRDNLLSHHLPPFLPANVCPLLTALLLQAWRPSSPSSSLPSSSPSSSLPSFPAFVQGNPVCARPGYVSVTAALFRELKRLDGLDLGKCEGSSR